MDSDDFWWLDIHLHLNVIYHNSQVILKHFLIDLWENLFERLFLGNPLVYPTIYDWLTYESKLRLVQTTANSPPGLVAACHPGVWPHTLSFYKHHGPKGRQHMKFQIMNGLRLLKHLFRSQFSTHIKSETRFEIRKKMCI